jgi:type IV pilus assembly protein PilW
MMNLTRFSSPSQRRQRGFSLVELMVALVLGLLVIGGVGGVFLSQREIYRQNENLARMQESARYAFEVMARSLREAGGIACGSNLPVTNVLNGASSNWWSNWVYQDQGEGKDQGEGILRGYSGYTGNDNSFPKAFGTGLADRVSGTDAVIVLSGTLNEGVTVTSHNSNSNPPYFTVNTNPGIDKGDILLVCDYKKAAIFQTTNVDSSNGTIKIEYNTGASVSPGNCSKYLGCSCGQPPGNPDPPNSNCGQQPPNPPSGFISKLAAYAWYIGYNGRGGRSLYRLRIGKKEPEEVAEGVSNLKIQYLTRDAACYVDADKDCAGDEKETDWTQVVAVRLEFTLQPLENVATGGGALQRTWNTVVTLRNRAP